MINMMFSFLKVFKALIDARIEYGEKKQGDKTFHEDIIEELKMLKAVVDSAIYSKE